MLPQRYDWFVIVTQIQRTGLPLRAIASRVDRALITLHGWTQGLEPRHYDGEALIRLWIERTGNVRESLPLVDDTRRPSHAPIPSETA